MLIESIVRFSLGIKDHRDVSVTFTSNELQISLDANRRRKLPCSICGKRFRPKNTLKERSWSHVSLWGIPVFLSYSPRRVNCPDHGVKVEKIPWSMGKRPLSFPLITVLAFWTRLLPWDQAGRLTMVYDNEPMTDKNGVEVNHFEPVPPLHDLGGILWKKIPPGPHLIIHRLIDLLVNTKNTSPNLRVRALSNRLRAA